MVQASIALLASKLGSRGGSRLRLVKSPVMLTEAATARIKELLAKRQKVTGSFGPILLSLQNQSLVEPDFTSGVPEAGHQAARLQRPGIHTELCRCNRQHVGPPLTVLSTDGLTDTVILLQTRKVNLMS